MPPLNILAIGAHPDDIELGCGGLLLKAVRKGHNLWMYTLTRARWFKRIWIDVKHCPAFMRLIVGYRLISWTCGIIGSWVFSPLWLTWTGHPLVLIWISIGGLYIWIIFIYSIIKTKQPLYYGSHPAIWNNRINLILDKIQHQKVCCNRQELMYRSYNKYKIFLR
jgi:hypothetical protein